MKSTEAYFAEMHEVLARERRATPDERITSCVRVACDIAAIRLREGGNPSLLGIRPLSLPPQLELFPLQEGEEATIGIEDLPKLTPWDSNGDFAWSCHVACLDGLVFDPMLAEPMDLEEYRVRAFRQPIEVLTLRDADAVRRDGGLYPFFELEEQELMNPYLDQWYELQDRSAARENERRPA